MDSKKCLVDCSGDSIFYNQDVFRYLKIMVIKSEIWFVQKNLIKCFIH